MLESHFHLIPTVILSFTLLMVWTVIFNCWSFFCQNVSSYYLIALIVTNRTEQLSFQYVLLLSDCCNWCKFILAHFVINKLGIWWSSDPNPTDSINVAHIQNLTDQRHVYVGIGYELHFCPIDCWVYIDISNQPFNVCLFIFVKEVKNYSK